MQRTAHDINNNNKNNEHQHPQEVPSEARGLEWNTEPAGASGQTATIILRDMEGDRGENGCWFLQLKLRGGAAGQEVTSILRPSTSVP